MVRTSFDGQTIAKVLRRHNYQPVGRTGSHLKLRWESPHTDEVRIVTVPMKPADALPIKRRGTLNRLCTLEERDDVASKDISGRNTVWWRTDTDA